jgi:hypothetical protein
MVEEMGELWGISVQNYFIFTEPSGYHVMSE